MVHGVPLSSLGSALTQGVDSALMEPHSVWEIIFLMLILKIPIVYLCVVVSYAIKAEPKPQAGASVTARVGPDDPGPGWQRRTRRRRAWPAQRRPGRQA